MASPLEEFPPGSIDYILHIITRKEWKARDWELEVKLKNLPRLPYKLVLDHYTYTDPCTTYEECVRAVQTMQEKDMSRGYNDIRFNFLIGGDGKIYEGRGWHICSSRSLRHFIKIRRRRLDIAFIGDYSEKPIPDVLKHRFQEVIDFGIKEDIIKRFPITMHVRKGIKVLPVEGTMDDFVGNALLKMKKREEEADEVMRETKQGIEEGKVNVEDSEDKETPNSDRLRVSHHKEAEEQKIYRDITSRMRDEFWKTEEIYRT